MKLFYLALLGLFLAALSLNAQNYLQPEDGIKVAYFSPEASTVQAFDLTLNYFYYNDGDTIHQVDPFEEGRGNKFGKPADYNIGAFPTFLSVSPDGAYLWAGYSDLANTDARIYRINLASGLWKEMAMMPSNWDLVFWDDQILVSGLNSADFNTPSGVYLLDTTGQNQHRKIVHVGGSSAGIALDPDSNLCFGTSSFSEPNGIYRIDEATLTAVIDMPDADSLTLADAEKLTDLPMGLYDCEVDVTGQVLFTMNLWGGTNVLGQWNGNLGAGNNYDTLATTTEWLGMLKCRGNYASPSLGNSLFTQGYGQAVADVHTVDYPPRNIAPLPVVEGFEMAALDSLDLSKYMKDLDDPEGMTYTISVMSEASVADLSIEGDTLLGNFALAGQSNLTIEGSSGGYTVRDSTVVGTWPAMEGDFLLSDFEDLILDRESFWNGSDESGSYTSGPARYHNDFNTEYFSWSGWAYSNTSDKSTPGFMNQYSAITGAGFESADAVGNYGVSSKYGPVMIDFPEKAHAPEGFYVTNSTYAALSMEEGDWAAKKFGGADGSDPDFFKLLVWGFADSTSTDTLDFYLADYRYENPEKDYIIKTWQWLDLSSMGKVDSLKFGLESSDNGDWGMNTPAYFCMDNFLVHPDAAPYVANPLPDMDIVSDGIQHIVDLSEVFSDADDADSLIVKTLVSDNPECPLNVSISGDSLIISTCLPTKSTFEDYEIVVEGSLGGLAAVDTFMIHLEIISGLENNPAPELHIYPNPSAGRFVISSGTPEEMDVSIYDITGTEIYTNRQLVPGQDVDISCKPAGAYIIRIRHSSGVSSKMIQKL